ncbi:HIT family protein [Nesterenkonia alkaliphila]|uniref:HIT domain-containing protein n=1 Tax=Nesterenkonia alkaliphila TaxID=1463631 RepID=A0A7K1UI39_9MICC|nr:HIT family protein [Nesterenkonia alkaliphila]MVT26140.1 HIT domain-containing protein [Nesterenkonia alkaliphila]GFZ84072.1 HIT family protein [Nesterenkonia alkaliphila]
MATVFSKVISGEFPGRFVWQDEVCVGFLSIAPLAYGHTLVVPRAEVDMWTDAEPELVAHLSTVAQRIGQAQVEAFGSARAGLAIAGYEVPHLHLHVWPSNSLEDFDFAKAMDNPDQQKMDEAAEKIRVALRLMGEADHVPAEDS